MKNTLINTRELMIGNWVKHKPEYSYRNTDEKEFFFQWELTDFYGLEDSMIHLDNIEPIPLTPEILLKAGFKWEGESSLVFKFDDFRNIDIHIPGFTGFLSHSDECFVLSSIKYLHRLQNLIYAVSGQELTITL